MSQSDVLSHLENKLAPLVTQAGLFLESVAITGPSKHRVLRVTVDLSDGPGGVGSDSLEEVTRSISEFLDDEDPISGAYNLEVTTPGVDRPLTTGRHFRRVTDRLVAFTIVDSDEKFTGRVISATETDVTVDLEPGERTVGFDEIANAVVELEFRPRSKAGKRGN